MSKKNATKRKTTHFDGLGDLARGKPKHGNARIKRANRKGRRKGR